MGHHTINEIPLVGFCKHINMVLYITNLVQL